MDHELNWLKSQKINPKIPGVMTAFSKFPSMVESLLEVFGTTMTGFVDKFYDELVKGLLAWLEAVVASNDKYADVARISNISFLVEALDIRGVRPQTTHHTDGTKASPSGPSFDFEVLCSRSIPPSINSFLSLLHELLNSSQQNYIMWMISYEFPGVSLLIERMNSVGARINKNELALFVRRKDVVQLAKDLEPKAVDAR